ncbi:MAG: hypothetical protein K0Q93_3312 [Nocardioidaceae bacterium]|jgi:hypothetical protein|nr:hypothetical protein [Nocardioidaceae bacterium]
MTDGDHVKFHGGPQDGHSMWVPFEGEGPPDVLQLPDLSRPLKLRDFAGPTKPGPSSLTYRRRDFMSDVDHAWHYDFEEGR